MKGFWKNWVIPQLLSEGDLIKFWRGGGPWFILGWIFFLYFCSCWGHPSPQKNIEKAALTSRMNGIGMDDIGYVDEVG